MFLIGLALFTASSHRGCFCFLLLFTIAVQALTSEGCLGYIITNTITLQPAHKKAYTMMCDIQILSLCQGAYSHKYCYLKTQYTYYYALSHYSRITVLNPLSLT